MLRDSILSSHCRKFVGSAHWSLVSFGKAPPEAGLAVFLLIKNEVQIVPGSYALEQLTASSHYEARASAMEA